MQLSERLETIISFVKPCGVAADIGTDHGFVPIEIVRRNIARRALACDVRKEPLQRAEEHIRRAVLSEKIECRLGNGLAPLEKNEAETVIIAGMGGTLMARILKEGEEVLSGVSALVLSPHTDAALVRAALGKLHFGIEEEKMVFEEGKYYVVFRAVPEEAPLALTEKELLYGPCLLKDRPEIFLSYLKTEEKKLQSLLEKLKSEEETEALRLRICETEKSLKMIRTVL